MQFNVEVIFFTYVTMKLKEIKKTGRKLLLFDLFLAKKCKHSFVTEYFTTIINIRCQSSIKNVSKYMNIPDFTGLF